MSTIEKHVYSAKNYANEIAGVSTKIELENLSKEMREEEARRIESAISNKYGELEKVMGTAIAKKKMPAPDGTAKEVPMTQEYFANKVKELQREGKTDELLAFTSSVNQEVDKYIQQDFNLWEKLRNYAVETGQGLGGELKELGKDTWKGMKTTPVERRVRNATGLGTSAWYVASIFLGPGKGRLITAGIAAVSAGVIPKIAILGMKTAEKGLELVGKGTFLVGSRVGGALIDIVNGDIDDIGNIGDYLRTNKLSSERLRDEISGFYDQGIGVLKTKPELIPNELRPIFAKIFYEKMPNVSGTKFEKNITEGFETEVLASQEREPLNSQEIVTSARFCLKGLSSECLSEGEIGQMKNLDQWKDWPPEVFQKIRVSLLTAEAGYLFHYFMVKASETERTRFIESFSEMMKSKKEQETMTPEQLANLPEKFKNLQGYTIQELQKIFPQFNEQDPKIMRALKKQPAGIRYGMEKSDLIKGGAVIGLLAWGIGILTYYTSKFILGDKKNKEKSKETSEGKYEKSKKEANRKLVILLQKTKIGGGDWKNILNELQLMSVLNKKEVKKLKGISTEEKNAIFEKMKNGGWINKTGSSNLVEISKLQDDFWSLIPVQKIKDHRLPKIGEIPTSGEIKKQRESARNSLKLFKETRDEYQKFLDTQPVAYQRDHRFFEVWHGNGIGNGTRKAFKGSEKFWAYLKKQGKTTKAGTWKRQWTEKRSILSQMEILGVHENEIKYLKNIPTKDGARVKAIYAQVDDLLQMCTPT